MQSQTWNLSTSSFCLEASLVKKNSERTIQSYSSSLLDRFLGISVSEKKS